MKTDVRRVITLTCNHDEAKAVREVARFAITNLPASSNATVDLMKLVMQIDTAEYRTLHHIELEEPTATALLNAAKSIARIAQKHDAGSNEHLASLIRCLTMEGALAEDDGGKRSVEELAKRLKEGKW